MSLYYNINSYINPYELQEKCKRQKYTVVLFGAGDTAKKICKILKDFDLYIDFIVDNDESKHGNQLHGISIVSPLQLKFLKNFLVIVGSLWYPEIIKQLSNMNINTDVYILAETLNYRYKNLFYEAKTRVYASNNCTNKSRKYLISATYGLGDIMVSLGILNYLNNNVIDSENYHFITDKKYKYDTLRLIFNNVLLVDEKFYKNNSKYRHSIIKWVNEQQFSSFVNLFFLPYIHYNYFDSQNSNIQNFHWNYQYLNNDGIQCNNIVEYMKPIACSIFNIPEKYNLDSKGILENYIKDVHLPTELLGKKYIACGFGGVSWGRCFPPEKFAKIAKHFIGLGYYISLLGAGKNDEKWNNKVITLLDKSNMIINLTDIDICRSFRTIQDANLFVGIDSGLSHAAYSLDKMAVVLRPSGTKLADCFEHVCDKKMIYIQNDITCKDCFICRFKKRRYGECIRLINPTEIIIAMESCLNSK